MTNSYYTLSPIITIIGRFYYLQFSVEDAKALRDRGLSGIVIHEGLYWGSSFATQSPSGLSIMLYPPLPVTAPFL